MMWILMLMMTVACRAGSPLPITYINDQARAASRSSPGGCRYWDNHIGRWQNKACDAPGHLPTV